MLGGAAVGLVSFAPSAIGQVPASLDTLPPSAPVRRFTLTARETEARLMGPDGPLTRRVCAYDGELFKMIRARAALAWRWISRTICRTPPRCIGMVCAGPICPTASLR